MTAELGRVSPHFLTSLRKRNNDLHGNPEQRFEIFGRVRACILSVLIFRHLLTVYKLSKQRQYKKTTVEYLELETQAFNKMAPSRLATPPPSETPLIKGATVDPASISYGDWRDNFYREGYVVIKGAVPAERAANYQSEALTWLEGFNLGFDRNKKSTWKKENLPQSWKGGMYLHFSAAHEKYVWDARWYSISQAEIATTAY